MVLLGRPLRLVDGYCCDWSLVSFNTVERALQELSRRWEADVLVCGGPLWLCLLLRLAQPERPLLAHCLTFQDLDLPLKEPHRWVHEKLLQTFHANRSGGKAFLIQDDLQRVYYSMAFDFTLQKNFTALGQISFFQMPYIQARYSQRRKQVLFLREGTTKRFTNSLRGHLWYLKLKSLIAEDTDAWTILLTETNRIYHIFIYTVYIYRNIIYICIVFII